MAEGPFGALGNVVGHLVALEVDAGDLSDHPVVELLVGVFVAHEGFHLFGVLNLEVVVVQLEVGDGYADLGGGDLFVDLVEFFVC